MLLLAVIIRRKIDQIIELIAQLAVLLKASGEVRDAHLALVSHAAHGLAHVLALHDDGEAFGGAAQCVAQHVDDFAGETLLKL